VLDRAPQAIEIAKKRLGNGDPPARGYRAGESIRRIPHESGLRPPFPALNAPSRVRRVAPG
jgi:hypothetical protein